MTPHRIFRIIYAPEVIANLRIIDPQYLSLLRKTIEVQLLHEPNVETRNRKPLLRPISVEAKWELRFGPGNCFRVFYAIDNKNAEVWILAIGVKKGEKIIFGKKEEKK
jgi:mRNA-degrading endonuclease RelE of RelBE toxin-antitoxin system